MSIWTSLSDLPVTLDFIDVDGVRTRSLRVGKGPPVLFLHGTCSHLEVFAGNFAAYARAGLCAYAIDMLGHGYTDKPDHDYEVRDYVDHVRRYLDAVGIDRVHLVGEALGGWVAAWFASEHPGRTLSLQLVCSGGTRAVPEVMARIRATTERAVCEDDRSYTYERLATLFFDRTRLSDEIVEARYRIYHQAEFRRALPHLLCLQNMSVRQRNLLTPDRLERIAAPTLIFWGRSNPMGDVSEAESIQRAIPGSRLVIFDRCGHFPQLEYPDRFNQESIRFIEGVSDRARPA